jgi:hypothetical protein
VDLKDFLSFDVALQIADQLNAELVGHFPITNSYVLDLRQTPKHLKELDALMARVAQDQRVAEVWHDIVLEPRQVRFAVVDVVDRYRHNRDNTRPTFPGDGLHGREDAWATDRIQAPGAWNLIERFIGRNNLRHVKVAVVDTGCDQTHPEFNGVQLVKVETTLVRVRIAGREVILPQANAFTERPYDLGDPDPDQHGTMVTSLIGARNGNVLDGATGDRGINGLLHNPMPYTIQVYRFWEDLLEAPAEESVTGLLAAINTAAITGANVMNASLSTIPLRPGHPSRPNFERSLRKIAHQLNVFRGKLLLVVAAGNDAEGGAGTNSGEIEPFEDLNLNLQLDRDAGEDLNGNDRPDFGNHIAASLGTLPNVIAVGAIGGPDHDPGPGRSWGRDDQRAEFSNWSAVRANGFDAVVQLAAPGTDVFTAGRGTFSFQIGGARFARSDGTSFAAPLVTGSAALLKAIDPTLTPAQLKQRLLDSAFAVNTTRPGGDLKWRTLKVGYAVRQLLVDRGVIGNDQPWTGVSKVVYDGLRMFEIRRGPDGRAEAFADRALAGLFGYSPSLAHHGEALIWIADERTIKQHVFSTGATGNFTVLNPPHTLTRILEAAPNLRYLFGAVTPDGDCKRQIQVHVGADVVADTGWYNICPSGIFGDRNWQHYFLHKGAWRPDNRAWALDYYHANGRGNTTNQECRAWWGDNPFPGGPFGFPGCTGTEFRYPAWAPEGRAYAGAEGARLKIAYYDAAHGYQFTWAVGDWPYPPILWLNWSPDGSELGVLGGNTLYTVRRDIRTPADRDPRPLRTIGNVVFTWQW